MISFDEIKENAIRIGWDDVGVTSAKVAIEDQEAYHHWLKKGFHAEMTYMENPSRTDPTTIFPDAKTAVIFVTSYKQSREPFQQNAGLIASYARGRDYHHLHRKRLKKFILWLEQRSGKKNIAKGFSDSTPVMEKALAVQAGLGWFGKNSLLIHRRFGTFILLSGLFTSLEIEFSTLSTRMPRCGSCQRCLQSCPTQALVSPYELDATRCLSFHTIESKNDIPDEIAKKNPGYIFGCDICQDVCPHNVRSPLTLLPEFSQGGHGTYLDENKLNDIEYDPQKLFGTPLQRRGINGLKKTFISLKEDNRKLKMYDH